MPSNWDKNKVILNKPEIILSMTVKPWESEKYGRSG